MSNEEKDFIFKGNQNIEKINMPDVVSVDDSFIAHNEKLQTINLPDLKTVEEMKNDPEFMAKVDEAERLAEQERMMAESQSQTQNTDNTGKTL